jgi:hypothetical protein
MPFTFSHPAIILPLTYLPRKWISLTGLIIGSLTPDFEYFLRMKIQSKYSHTIDGLFWFDLPLGLLLAFIFHNVVRNKLFDNLLHFLKIRVSIFKIFNWNEHFKTNWFVVIVSTLIGAASHIFWDSFTHDHGYFVDVFSALRETIDIFGIHIPILKLLQHTSTIIGGLVIGIAVYKLPIKIAEERNGNLNYWFFVSVLTLTIISMRFFSGLEYYQYGNVIVTVISSLILGLILTPLIFKITKI